MEPLITGDDDGALTKNEEKQFRNMVNRLHTIFQVRNIYKHPESPWLSLCQPLLFMLNTFLKSSKIGKFSILNFPNVFCCAVLVITHGPPKLEKSYLSPPPWTDYNWESVRSRRKVFASDNFFSTILFLSSKENFNCK